MLSLDDDAAARMVERLTATQTALAVLDHDARRVAFPAVLAQLADRHSMRNGLISGRATRLLHDAGRWDATRVEHRLSQALSPGTPPDVGAAFVEGFLAGSGTVLVHDTDLLGVVDRLAVVAATRGFRVGRCPAAAHLRCLRTCRTTSDHVAVARWEIEPGLGIRSRRRRVRAAAALEAVRHLLGSHSSMSRTAPITHAFEWAEAER